MTQYNTPPPNTFIRRKIALLAFQQKNSKSYKVDDNLIDQRFDQKIFLLRQKDPETNVPRTDQVYVECLIRANFDDDEAFDILRHNRPNLVCCYFFSNLNKSKRFLNRLGIIY